MTEEDALMDGLTPLEAQAFHQNGTLRPEIAVRLAEDWVDAGDDHVDVAMLAAVDYPSWYGLEFYFKTAMTGKGIPDLSGREAAAIRLDRLLRWTADHGDRLRDLHGNLIDHCQPLRRKALPETPTDTQSEIAEAIETLTQASEDYFDLSVSINVTKEMQRQAIADADAKMNSLRGLIRTEFGRILSPPD